MSIGLLGGSFNPAHDGHLHISLEAIRRLGLDRVWWLVSPQNPLKSSQGMASLQERVAGALRIAVHPRIQVTTLETLLGTRYTVHTLDTLHNRFPGARFVWLMGADNLGQIDRWAGWIRIFHTTPIAVFDRPTYSSSGLGSKAARRFRKNRVAPSQARSLSKKRPPCWVFLPIPRHPASATAIRGRLAALIAERGRSPEG